jgi:hypothetical protein
METLRPPLVRIGSGLCIDRPPVGDGLAPHLGEFGANVVLKRLPPLSPLHGNDRRTILVGAGENGYRLAGITRYCFRAATKWAAIVFVGSDGLMLTNPPR